MEGHRARVAEARAVGLKKSKVPTMEPRMKLIVTVVLEIAVVSLACIALGGCEDSQKSKKTPISGTATFPKASFQKGEKLE